MVYVKDVTMNYCENSSQVLVTKGLFSLGKYLEKMHSVYTPFLAEFCTNKTLVEAMRIEDESIKKVELGVIPETYAGKFLCLVFRIQKTSKVRTQISVKL